MPPEILQLGPFMLKYNWLLLAVAGAAGYGVMKYRLKKVENADHTIFDVLLTALLIMIVCWKLSPFLFSPDLWKKPLSVLLMSGSAEGAAIAAAIAVIYIGIKCWKKGSTAWHLPDLLSYGITVMLIIYSLLSWQYGKPTQLIWGISIMDPNHRYHPVNVYKIMVSIPMLWWLWRRPISLIGSGELFANFLTLYGIGLLAVSFFELQNVSKILMSWEQLIYLLMVIGGTLLNYTLKKKKMIPN